MGTVRVRCTQWVADGLCRYEWDRNPSLKLGVEFTLAFCARAFGTPHSECTHRPTDPRPHSFARFADDMLPPGRPCRIVKAGGVSSHQHAIVTEEEDKDSRYAYVDGYY
jgi:hypothetical protein